MGKAGGFAAAAIAAKTLALTPLLYPTNAEAELAKPSPESRLDKAFVMRRDAALRNRILGAPAHPTNGDEALYRNKIGNYTKGLPHNGDGQVDLGAYESLVRALRSGNPADFENIILGGTTRLVNPQSGLAFDMEGLDCSQLAVGPPPSLATAWRAAEGVEGYWMALLRDVNFTQYETDPLAQQAAAELSHLAAFRGPRKNGRVTAKTLFRGFTHGDIVGPYVSQFLLRPFEYGAISIDHRLNTYLPGVDYLTTPSEWLAVQNGVAPAAGNQIDSAQRYVRNGRDLAAYVHIDVLFQAYFNAALWLLNQGAPPNRGNPYRFSRTQVGFGTFGAPHLATLLCEVSTRALKAVWHEKWFVHRTLRPEEFGGLVHFTKTGAAAHPLHSSVLNSQAVAEVFARTGSYLLPQAFPEGCPQHPSYGSGHATVAGACSTVVKAFFDESYLIPDPMIASEDGLSLVPYTGSDAGRLTLGSEMAKVSANAGIGRNFAGIHWRHDYQDSMRLGEAVAISVMRDQRHTYNEVFSGLTFTRLDGTTITV